MTLAYHFSTWIYHHENIHDPGTKLTFWPQDQIYRAYDVFGSQLFLSFYVVILCLAWLCGMMCCIHLWPLYDLELWPQYRNYIFNMNLSLARSSLLYDTGIPNFDIWVYRHETTCIHSWPLYDLDLWPICTCRWP